MAKIFLLGGYDLEMLEIKKLLRQEGKKFLDKQLSWGAKLSDYKENLNEEDHFIGIELETDIEVPKHYELIDHHGELSSKPSALEQIAAMLNVELNRWQQLVAANDARYIEGMQKLCATVEEIQKIRKADREVQGVTPRDEELAILSIKNANYSNYIYSYTSYFSAIADRVYDKKEYVIYNDEKIVFYGYSIRKIIEFLNKKDISSSSYYYGGGDYGFIGIKNNFFTSEEIKNIITEFQELEKELNIKSYHTFMLPLKFEGKFVENTKWINKAFQIKEQRDFNEYVYFYDHVQDALYNKEEKNSDNKISNYFEYHIQNGEYIIEYIENNKIKTFQLELDGISLRIFNTNVAILSFNLKNKRYDNKDDILKINEYGRRIYPQFVGNQFVYDTKKSFLANKISINLEDPKSLKKERVYDDFCEFNTIEGLDKKKDDLLPKFIKHFINIDDFKRDDNFQKKKLCPIIDDRMFVISIYMNDDLSLKLKEENKEYHYCYENNEYWYKYLFIDTQDKTCQSKYMTKELILASTYDRWVEWGTLFGISRYSFVSLTGSSYGKNILLAHMQTMYFQIFSLLLAYRATIIKFSDEIQNITSRSDEKIIDDAKDLYQRYLSFLNKLYFKEVTAQDQGIELYNKAMQIMDIPKYMNDLDNEINELHHYVDMIEEKKRNKKLDAITYLGGLFLPLSLVLGFFGINVGESKNFSSDLVTSAIVVTIVITCVAMVVVHKSKKGAS